MTEKEFRNIVSENKDRMYSLACSIVSNKEQAEDIINEVLLKLWNRLKIFPPPLKVRSYLFTSLRNACYDYLRSNSVRRKYENDEDVSVAAAHETFDEESIDKKETVKQVRQLIEQLNDKEKEVIKLKDIFGYETNEIAELLDISESNVRARLSRARCSLKAAVINYMKKESR